MKLSDYILEYLQDKGVYDYFGYQGTMIAHFIDSIGKNKKLKNHVLYNEQGVALAAVGYYKSSGKNVCAYSTSGPGATNMITGIADAYYDSVPIIFITGQLNSYEYSNIKELRQQGFQETDIVTLVKGITKYAVKITEPEQIAYELEKAYYYANEGRKGPVLLDIPMNIQKAIIDIEKLRHFEEQPEIKNIDYDFIADSIISLINKSERPCLILGNGIGKKDEDIDKVRMLVNKLRIPVIYSMLGKHYLLDDDKYNFGFIGTAYGQRYSNIIACKKTDLIVSLGCRLNGRSIGLKREKFNPNAQIIRVEIDEYELKNYINNNDIHYQCDVNELIDKLIEKTDVIPVLQKENWLKVCDEIKYSLIDIDKENKDFLPNKFIEQINNYATSETDVFVDVGQNQIWAAHSIKIKSCQRIIFSGGLGAMGFSLPAAIGGVIAKNNKAIVICGDGGLQMNIQEMQTVFREQLPITIIVFNNNSLGLIHQQQCDFFDNKFYGACEVGGYTSPSFKNIGLAYNINSYETDSIEEFCEILKECDINKPNLIEIKLPVGTKAYPKTYFGNEMINQRPEIDDELLNHLLSL